MGLLNKMKNWFVKQPSSPSDPVEVPEHNDRPTREHIVDQFSDCYDFVERSFPEIEVIVHYLTYIVGHDELTREIVTPFSNAMNAHEVEIILSRSQYTEVIDSKACVLGILHGKGAIFFQNRVYLVDITHNVGRTITPSETESVITGPHDGFVEGMTQNLSLIRRRIKSSHLKFIKLEVGEVTKTDVMLVYITDIANEELIQMLKKRIQSVEIDAIYDTNMLVQYIDENPNSVFPQFLTTERPDVIASKIVGGRIAIFTDGSPTVAYGPSSFFDFFSSPDDYYSRWHIGTALRLLRFEGFIITVIFTPLYVAVTTFHYEMVPHTMLLQLAASRERVPFPPLIEALVMETTIELLREAGARLPSKIGQTIGIVGGIVIGQASVQAGFTSNILIIVVAISAIASFVIPTYLMSASFRLIRFGLILLSGMLGIFGLVIGIGLMAIHLSGITNLGTSYLSPLAPMSPTDWLDSFVRGPYSKLRTRPTQAKPQNQVKNRMRR